MAGNSHSTFGKRQKERARQEKQAEKAQRRAERKLQQKDQGDAPAQSIPKNPVVTYDEDGNPEALNFHDF
ncbi:MAG TPA: hypothetical protein VIB39_13390 [Candidatus Angelobacter sp.]|jgi:hypothetical protein